jgi:hypothetical protein
MDAPPKSIHDPHRIDDETLLKEGQLDSYETAVSFLTEKLPLVWRGAYLGTMPREANIVRVQHRSFEYIYDSYASSESTSPDLNSPAIEARLVGVSGRSVITEHHHDSYRLSRWPGEAGPHWDKAQFIGPSIGGAVDKRDINRGWSKAGRRYRGMLLYCASNPGVFCFSRPI